jgi:hypothetical protein
VLVRPGGFELPTFWFVAVAARTINNLQQLLRFTAIYGKLLQATAFSTTTRAGVATHRNPSNLPVGTKLGTNGPSPRARSRPLVARGHGIHWHVAREYLSHIELNRTTRGFKDSLWTQHRVHGLDHSSASCPPSMRLLVNLAEMSVIANIVVGPTAETFAASLPLSR